MTRRNLELLLLIVAAPIVILLFAMLALTQGNTLGLESIGVPVGLFVAFFAAHFAVRKFAPNADPGLLPITFVLAGIGIAFVTRLAPDDAPRQVLWLFCGIAAMIVVLIAVRNLDRLANYKYTFIIVGVLLLLSPMLPFIGTENYGSRIWLTLGPLSVQPGEFAKLFIVVFMASYLAQNREMLSVFTWKIGPVHLPDLRAILPLLLMWGMALIVVIFEKDLGSALVFFAVFVVMLYVATGKKFYLVVSLGLAAIAAVFLYGLFSHVQVRVQTWLDPFAYSEDGGYQLVQAIYSMADGDLFGVGIGRGLCDLIPVVASDFIFAAISEETGLLGAAGVLLLFLSFAIRGFLTASRAKSDVSSLMATGLTTIIALQAFIIVGGVTRVIPLTGLTLPFMSQGGSSLLASLMIVGLLLRCGDESAESGEELHQTGLLSNSILGRVSLGKRLTGTLMVFSILFVVLVVQLTNIMVVSASEIQSRADNNHTIAKTENSQRGTISTYDGVVLAQSVYNEQTQTYERVYPAGTLASHVVGYCSTRYGTAGIEATCNEILQGQKSFATWEDVINSMAGTTTAGNSVKLTINSKIQKAAEEALEGEVGACVVIDPTTGAVLAMASSPTYDASEFESIYSGETSVADGTFVNRAIQTTYAPGSTFKMVSLSVALENNVANESDTFNSPGTMELGGAEINNFNDYNYGTITLRRATELSSNTVYGQLGLLIGARSLAEGADKFGFDNNFDFDLELATSLMYNPDDCTDWEVAWAAAGMPVNNHNNNVQGRGPRATVLQMAMVGCAIANNGTIMKPYLVESVYNTDGVASSVTSATKLYSSISATTAERVRDVLKGVVNSGTGTAVSLYDYGIQVAGKTGTAEATETEDDSWFVGMAPADNANVVVAMVLEKSTNAVGKSRPVFIAALEAQGVIVG